MLINDNRRHQTKSIYAIMTSYKNIEMVGFFRLTFMRRFCRGLWKAFLPTAVRSSMGGIERPLLPFYLQTPCTARDVPINSLRPPNTCDIFVGCRLISRGVPWNPKARRFAQNIFTSCIFLVFAFLLRCISIRSRVIIAIALILRRTTVDLVRSC